MATENSNSASDRDHEINHWIVRYEDWVEKNPERTLDDFVDTMNIAPTVAIELKKIDQSISNLDKTIRNQIAQTSLPAGPSISEGDKLGTYTIVEPLGTGGMGNVWLANQQSPVKRQVAIKLVNFAPKALHLEDRLEREASVLGRLSHPNIGKIFDHGIHLNHPYLVLEYIPGQSLFQYCEENNLSLRERLELFLQVCEGIQNAHQNGVLHRDIKPANVMVMDVDGRPMAKVIDFGLAYLLDNEDAPVLTQSVLGVGSPLWMSPEHVRGQLSNGTSENQVDTRSDVYSLGCVLFQLLTGTTPIPYSEYKELTVRQLLDKVELEVPESPRKRFESLLKDNPNPVAIGADQKVDAELDWITLKALEKDPERRYQTVTSLAEDVRRFLDGYPVEACPPSKRYRLYKFAQRNKLLVGLTSAFVLLLLVSSVVSSVLAIWALDQRNKANLASQEAKQERDSSKAIRNLLVRVVSGNNLSLSGIKNNEQLQGYIAETRQILLDERSPRNQDFAENILTLARVEIGSGNFPNALDELNVAEEIFKRLNFTNKEIRLKKARYLKAKIFFEREQFQKSLKILADIDVPELDSELDFQLRILKLRCQCVDGFFDEVPDAFNRLLKNATETFGKTSQVVGEINYAIGRMHFRRRAHAIALNYFQDAHEIFSEVDGQFSLDAIRAQMMNLYTIAAISPPGQVQNRLDTFLTEVEKKFGENHAFSMGPKSVYAYSLKYANNSKKAFDKMNELLVGVIQNYGKDSVVVANTRLKLSRLAFSNRNPKLSLELARKAEKTFREQLGEDSIPCLTAQMRIAWSILGSPMESSPVLVGEAREKMERAIKVAQRVSGKHSMLTQEISTMLSMALNSSGETDAALEQLQQNLRDSRTDGDSVFTGETLMTMAQAMLWQNKPKEFEKFMIGSLKIRTKTQSYLAVDTHRTYSRALNAIKRWKIELSKESNDYLENWKRRYDNERTKLKKLLADNERVYFKQVGDELVVTKK